jgi:hypothetical protein
MRRSACRFRESLAVCAVLRAWEPDTNGHAYQLFVWRDTPSGSTLRIVSEEATIGPDLGRLAVQSSQAQDRLACLASNAAPLRSKRWRGLGRHGPLLADTVEVLACVPVSRADHLAQRPPTCEEDHFPESLARAMIEAFSRPGDVVLDPFAGYGTTARSRRGSVVSRSRSNYWTSAPHTFEIRPRTSWCCPETPGPFGRWYLSPSISA